MPNGSTPKGVAKLRLLIQSIIAEEYKAYDLPVLCERLGMEPGSESEAMNSKRLYVQKRLQRLNEQGVLRVAAELATEIENEQLNELISGSSPSDDFISGALLRFDSEVVHKRWAAALDRRRSDPEGAITLARTLLEDVLKWLLTKQAIPYDPKADLPILYRAVAKNLNLAPDAHTEEVFKRILGSCQSVVESLGTLRNKLGDAHSSGPLRAKPHPRHAELAVNLAGTMATFLVATWEARIR